MTPIALSQASLTTAIDDVWTDTLDYFQRMDPSTLAINAGWSVLILFGAAVVGFVLSTIIRQTFKAVARAVLRNGDTRPPSGLRIATRLVGAAVWLSAIFAVLGVWGLDVYSWATGPGAPLVAGALRVVVVIVLSVVAWEVATLATDRAFTAAASRADSARRASQLRSLAPMIRGAVRTAIVVIAVIWGLSQLNVDIGPLLAGAGVVGIAVGFGAQTIVKDYLTGFALILEDIVSVGDVVRIGDDAGLVESMTLRTIRLRDLDGTLHVIPNGSAQVVHNMTKAFSYYVFDLSIDYGSDIDKALDVMRQVGEEMRNDPQFQDLILGPLEVFGVDKLADSGVILKARIKTAPIKQWEVGRAFNRRIKLAFDAAGVQIPFPHMKIIMAGSGETS